MGFSPDVIGAANWGLGAACAALAGVIVVPIVGLDITGLSLMIVPAFAAALLGAFRSFGLTVITGVLIGIVESEVTLHTTQTGLPQAVPFVVIIVAMVITGKLIPARGTLGLERPAFAPPSRLNPVAFLAVGGGVTLALALFNPVYIAATTTSLLAAIIGLSLVLVTGFLGQISLAQMAFAGAGAFAAAKFSSSLGIPFPWPVLMASVVGGLSGLVIGLPALRIRGLNLAVVTLGLSVAVSAAVLSAPNLNGASGAGTATDAPSLWGFSLAPAAHPFRYGMLVLIVLGVMAAIVINIRRSPMGQRMLAVRSNERSAAAAGINVSAVKLQGFALSAAIASIGGALIAYQIGIATPDSFQAFSSITILVLVYIGGIACVSGALIAGLITSGGVIYTLLTGINGISNYWLLLSGVGLIITALTQPDGVAVANMRMWRTLKRKVGRELPTPAIPAPPGRLGDEVRDPTEVARS
jgi:ABC-type branched-subunit amino acid transport system permease subunit